MRNYDVLVERQNGHFRAMIPTLPNIAAEGATRDEAIVKAKAAARDYLAGIEVATIQLEEYSSSSQMISTVEDLLAVAGAFRGDELAMERHIEDIYKARKFQSDDLISNISLSTKTEGIKWMPKKIKIRKHKHALYL